MRLRVWLALTGFLPALAAAEEPDPYALNSADVAKLAEAIEQAGTTVDWESPPAESVAVENLGEVWRINQDIYTGPKPTENAHYRALQQLGISTLICIDIEPVDPAAAREAGVFAFHIPFAYGPVNTADQAFLNRVLSFYRKKYYICAAPNEERALAPAALAAQWYETRYVGGLRAMRLLNSAGVDESDFSQWKSVLGTARELSVETVSEQMPLWWETNVPAEPLVAAMRHAGQSFAFLREFHANGWRTPEHLRDISPDAELKTIGSTLRRRAKLQLDGEEMAVRMLEAAAAAEALRAQIGVPEKADEQWQALQNACMSCHIDFRE